MSKTRIPGIIRKNNANKQTRIQKAIALTVASFFTMIVSMALSMILPRMLSLTEIAIYKQTILAYETFVPILGLGISRGILYNLSRNDHRQLAIVKESGLTLFLTGLIYSLFIIIGGRFFLARWVNNPYVVETLIWMAPLAMFALPADIRGSVFVYKDKINQNVRFSTISSLFCVLCVFFAVLVIRTSIAAVISYSLSHIIVSVMGIALAIRLLPKENADMSFASFRAIVAVSLPLGVASMIGTLSSNLDKWIISFMRSPEEFAVFSYGAHEIPFIDSIAAAIGTVIIVDMVRYTKDKNYSETLRLFRRVAELTSYAIFPIMMLLMAVTEPLFEIMYTKTMLSAVPVFRVYLLLLPFRIVYYSPLMIALGKSKQVLYRTIIGLIVDLLLSIAFVHLIGGIGATVATVISVYLIVIPYNILVISKEMGVTWTDVLPWKHIAKCALLALPPGLLTYALKASDMIKDTLMLLIMQLLLFILFCAPLYICFFRIDTRAVVRKLLHNTIFKARTRKGKT